MNLLEGFPRQKIVFFTGSGISKESGIPTFRDEDGLWKNHNPEELASVSGFFENLEIALEFLNNLRLKIYNAQPNHAHQIIAALEQNHDVTVVTQNVDDLHERAGSSKIIHLHGEFAKVTSSLRRMDPQCIRNVPMNVPIKVGDKAADGSQERPAIVMFGEYLPEEAVEAAEKALREADIVVVIGTSLKVYPAASYIGYASNYALKYIIDPGEPNYTAYDFTHIRKPATEGIDTCLDLIASQL